MMTDTCFLWSKISRTRVFLQEAAKKFHLRDFFFFVFFWISRIISFSFFLSIGKCVEFEKVCKKVFNTQKCYKCWKPIGFMAFFPSYFAFLRHFVFTYQHFQHSKCWKLYFSTFVHNAQMLTLLLIFERFEGCLLKDEANLFLKSKNEFLQDKYIFYHTSILKIIKISFIFAKIFIRPFSLYRCNHSTRENNFDRCIFFAVFSISAARNLYISTSKKAESKI